LLCDFIVQLFAVNGSGVPSHLSKGVLAQIVVPGSAVVTGQSVTATADFTGTSLVQGTGYAVTLSRPGPDSYQDHFRQDSGCFGRPFIVTHGALFATLDPKYEMLVSVFIS
jgi:hypothetical protein